MTDYRFILDKGSKKHFCPDCNKRRLVRYIDVATGEYLPAQYGRCDREINCAYHLNPYSNGLMKDYGQIAPVSKQIKPNPSPKSISSIPFDVLNKSRSNYECNNLIQWLLSIFDSKTTTERISRYHIGTSNHWQGATVFWQIDQQGRIRTGKIILYSNDTGKRFKEPNRITWVHKVLRLAEFTLQQCLFGEHLLLGNSKPIAIVEGEKTAIIASVYFPQVVWLATGNLNGLTAERCQVLKGRKVYLFPDLGCFDRWQAKANELSNIAHFTISDLLECTATEAEKEQGLDLADFLIRYRYKDFARAHFTGPKIEKPKQSKLIPFDEYVNKLTIENKLLIADSYPASWDLTAPYLDNKTKNFIKLACKNPSLLKLQNNLNLTLNNN